MYEERRDDEKDTHVHTWRAERLYTQKDDNTIMVVCIECDEVYQDEYINQFFTYREAET